MNKDVYFTLPRIFNFEKTKFHTKFRQDFSFEWQYRCWWHPMFETVYVGNFSEFMRFGFRFLSFIWPWQLLYFIFSKVTTLELTLVEPILESNNRVHLISDLWGRTYIRRLDIYPVHIELWHHHFLVDSKIKAGIDIVSDLNLKSSYFLSGSILLRL